MGKLTTTETKGGAQQYTRGGGEGEKSKNRVALDITQDERPGMDASTAKNEEIQAAQTDPKLRKKFIEKYGLTPNKAEAMMSAAFAGASRIGSSKLENFYQDRVSKEPKVKNKLGNKKPTRSKADRPGKGSDEPITKTKAARYKHGGAVMQGRGGSFKGVS